MRTLLVCRGPIAFETLEVYRQRGWQLPHVIVSAREWIAEIQRTAPWIIGLPPEHVHYVQEYNDLEAILRIIDAYHIDAVYPGYGFLAESATFAERVEQAGVRFIGPTPATLRAVGDKDAAITLAKQLGIPTVPGDDALIAFAQMYPQTALIVETIQRTLALAQRYPASPIRLKHPAGGGGKGQRVLAPEVLQSPQAAEAIREALTKVWSEMGVSSVEEDARKGVLLELNIPRPLHWEVQIFGDGTRVVHFAARDCSVQNQGYQKFIELALHPQAIMQELATLDVQTASARLTSLQQRQATLERICADALRLGSAVHLRGAATVEFLIDQQGAPYFLEVNPRIQVEHGVTEGIARVHGEAVSLVELQQRVAAGEQLSFTQDDITFTGDAIEVRLNAWHEDLNPVLGGVVHTLRLTPPKVLVPHVRLEASGLLQRRQPWMIPSYDANFALLIVTGTTRHEALDRLLTVLEQALALRGNAELQTNIPAIIGLLTLMRALPPETAFRTDTSLLWMALAAVVVMQKQAVLALAPHFPSRPGAHDPARFARLLRTTLEQGFAHPSRLLTYYLRRLTEPTARPISALEVLWQLAAVLAVPLYAEERAQAVALQQAIDALWGQLVDHQQGYELVHAAAGGTLETSSVFHTLCAHLVTTTPSLEAAEAASLVRYLCDWLCVEIPALTALVTTLEQTSLHTLLTLNADLSLTRPAYAVETATVEHLQRLLSGNLRPTLLRHGELLSPMEATIYHQPEPGAPPFAEVGAEVKVGQTLALLEAMKMFTELPSPVDGMLVDILVESGQGVKTGTPLFRIATQDALTTSTDLAVLEAVVGESEPRFGLLLPEKMP
jgi:acetyl/propionyl-CoA carboxylase alpha subunit